MSTASGDEERSAVDGSKAPGGTATASEGSAGRRSAAWLMKKLEATKAASQAKREALRIMDSAFWNGEADVRKLARAALIENLDIRGLDTSGNKRRLQQRLSQFLEEAREDDKEERLRSEAARREQVAMEEAGSVYSVGSNAHGQLGHGDLAPRGFFECIAPIRGKGVDKVYAGSDYAMMLTEDNEVYVWGGGGYGPLGCTAPAPQSGSRRRTRRMTSASGAGTATSGDSDGGDTAASPTKSTARGRLSSMFGSKSSMGSGGEGMTPATTSRRRRGTTMSTGGASEDENDGGDGSETEGSTGPGGGTSRGGSSALTRARRGTAAARGVPVDKLWYTKPVLCTGLIGEGITAMALGASHVCAISKGGDVYTWGQGKQGQLGTPALENLAVPTCIDALQERTVVQIAAGHCHSIAVLDTGEVYAWGNGSGGRLGLGALRREGVAPPLDEYFPTPTAIPVLRRRTVMQVCCSANHSIALVKSLAPGESGLWSWGSGDGGRLGHGDVLDRTSPTPIEVFKKYHVLSIACGYWHSAALVQIPPTLGGGQVLTWGSGFCGQLGVSKLQVTLEPVFVSDLHKRAETVTQISCGAFHNAVICFSGSIYAWGSNRDKCLGIESMIDFADTPQPITAFDVMLDGIGRGVPRSVACGREYTIVATYPYDGPSEVELMEQEMLAVQNAEIVALREAEADLARAKDTQQAVSETLRAMTKIVKTTSDLCTLCAVCSGFEPNLFKPAICKLCSHPKTKHVRDRPKAAAPAVRK